VPDQYPGGFLTLGGRSVQEYEEEILNLVHHEEQERNARETLLILEVIPTSPCPANKSGSHWSVCIEASVFG
jgi:hypothetical protein